MAKTSTKKKVSKGVAIEASVDDLHNLRDDEVDHELMWLNRMINTLIKNDITTISQIRLMYDKYGEQYCIDKISELRLINKKSAENIITKAICYNYPKGYTPIAKKLPDWVMNDHEVAKKKKGTKANKKELPVPKDNEEQIIIEDQPIPTTTEATTPETESIDVNSYASNLVDESELSTMVLSAIFDLFEDDSYYPEKLQNDPMYKYEQQNIYYNSSVVLIQKEFLMKVFEDKYKNVKTIHNISNYNMFHIGLKNLGNCVYHYPDKKTGMIWWWGRKSNLLGANQQNYIEVNRSEAEQMLNRKFNIASDEDISQIMEDLGFNNVVTANQMSNKYKFYIIPEACNYENGKHIFKFNIAEIRDRFDFNMKNIDWKSGSYIFSKSDLKNGELMLSRGFTDADYDEIHDLVGDFLTK